MEDSVSVSRVKALKQRRFKRAGVIPYIKTERGLVYILARDRKYGTPGAFSGHVERDESAIAAALREFKEESLGCFGSFTVNQISDCFVIYDKKELIVLIPIDIDQGTVETLFRERVMSHTETSELLFMSSDELLQTLCGFGKENIHRRINRLLISSIETYGRFL